MRYTLDFEFCSHNNVPLTMALVRSDRMSMYVGFKDSPTDNLDPWVMKNVVPLFNKAVIPIRWRTTKEIQEDLEKFFKGDDHIRIVTDWPDDVAYFSKLLLTGPGTMINIPGITFEVIRIDAYPSRLKGAIAHNAHWDALALLYKLDFPNLRHKDPLRYLLVKTIGEKRYYYQLPKLTGGAGQWTRKRKKATEWEHLEELHSQIVYLAISADETAEAYNVNKSFKNQSHSYYGRTKRAIAAVKRLFDIEPSATRKGQAVLSIVEDGGFKIWEHTLPVDLTDQVAFQKKERKPKEQAV
jgi:hypothetical protein